jgi:O-antigen/teichoic acid export membrane protein
MVKNEIRLKYSGLVVFASKLLSVATGLAFTLMIARNTTTEEYGIFGNMSDILGYFTLLAGVLPFWTTRFVARDHAGSAKTGLISNMLISVISASIYLTLLPAILPALQIYGYTIVYAFISIEILELYTLSVLQAILQARKPQAMGYGILMYETCKVILGSFLIIGLQLNLPLFPIKRYLFVIPSFPLIIRGLQLGLLGVLCSMIIAYFIQIAFFFKLTAEELKGSFRLAYLKEWLKASPINFYSVVGFIIPGFSLIFLFMYAEAARAYYLAAFTIASIIGYSVYLTSGLYPKLLSKINIKDVSTSLKMVLMLAIPMTVGAMVLSDSYITILKSEYADAKIVLSILAISVLSMSLSGVFETVVMGTEKIDAEAKIAFKKLLKTRLFQIYTLPYIYSAIVLPTTFFALFYIAKTPLEAATYVAVITLIGNLAMLLCKYVISHRCLAFKFPWKALAKYATASAAMAIPLFIIPHPTKLLSTLLSTGAGGITYLATLAAIDMETRQLIKSIIKETKSKLGVK